MTVLRVADARRRYGEVTALDGLSLEVGGGEVLALLGPNGAGKSTLIRAITTLEQLDSGAITLGGIDVASDPSAARAKLGFAGQEPAIDKVLTGREFLRFQAGLVHLPPSEIGTRVDQMLSRFELQEAAGRRCEGYSGGMKRRLDLAASLLHRPDLLILDEPSSGLDYDARRNLWKLLSELRAEGTALLLATHDFEEAEVLADRVVLVSHGRVAAAGTPDMLRQDLGAWVLSASIHEFPGEGDRETLTRLFGAIPGRALPSDPHQSAFHQAVEHTHPSGRPWSDIVQESARAAGLELFSISLRRPTLQDVYLAATEGEPLMEEAG